MARKDSLIGAESLRRSFDALGKVPQTVATQSSRAGASVAQKAAKRNAPVDEGYLKRSIVIKRSRGKRVKGSAIHNVMIDPSMNDHFVKISKDGKRSYYPASQEFGWFTVDGRYIPGYGYLRRSVDENEKEIETAILKKAKAAIDRAMRKK